LEIYQASRDYLGSVSCATELKVFTYHTFQQSLEMNKVYS
jgi:hypothetical protein